MSHEIETMAFQGETPWHKLGKRVQYSRTAGVAIKDAGLDWQVEMAALYLADGRPVEKRAVIRSTDRSILGVVGTGYTPLQNQDAFNFFNPFLDAGEATIETAGSLFSGKRVWALARLNRSQMEIVKGDPVTKYLLLSNSHDGTSAVKVGFTPIRVVCANTLAMADTSSQSQLLRVKHTKSVHITLDKVREIVSVANAQFEATAEQYRFLAKKSVNKKDLQNYIKQVFYPGLETPEDATKRQELRMERLEQDLMKLFEAGRGTDIQGVRGTAWGMYNAVTEYLSYDAVKDSEQSLNSLWYGNNANVNQRAFEAALRI